jgi:hypothetical protein
MSTVLNIPLSALDEQFVQDLKHQFGPVEVEIRINGSVGTWLTEEQFWDIIQQFDWNQTGKDDAVMAPAIAALAAMPIAVIHQFEDILAEKLWHLDTPDHADASLNNDPDANLSVDGFLYDRCCVVANGRDYYEKVLHDPSKMPTNFSFGRLLSLSEQAYRLKTGKSFLHIPKYSYETYSNEQAWSEA